MRRIAWTPCKSCYIWSRVLGVFLVISLMANLGFLVALREYRLTSQSALDALKQVRSWNNLRLAGETAVAYANSVLQAMINDIETTNRAVKTYTSIKAVVTAYTPYAESTGKTPDHPLFNVTKSGFRGGGGICAADTRYWPLGTVLYVSGLGACVVLDTGGAIKGKYRFDYYIPGDEQSAVRAARKWGRRNTTVYVLYKPAQPITWAKVMGR